MTSPTASLLQHLLTSSDLAQLEIPASQVEAWLGTRSLAPVGELPSAGADAEQVFSVTDAALRRDLAVRLAAAGKPIVTNPFPQLVMYQAGLFDPAAEIAQIERREFGLVVLRGFFYPKPVLDAIGQNYVWQRSVVMNNFQYHIYAPGP